MLICQHTAFLNFCVILETNTLALGLLLEKGKSEGCLVSLSRTWTVFNSYTSAFHICMYMCSGTRYFT